MFSKVFKGAPFGNKMADFYAQPKAKKSDSSWGEYFGLVQKGAPFGNKNAAGKRSGHPMGYSPKAQAAAAATAKAKGSGSAEDHMAAFDAHRRASSAANRHGDKRNATLHSQQAQSHYRQAKKTAGRELW